VMAVAVVFFLGRLIHHRGLGGTGLQQCAPCPLSDSQRHPS
jgi:hypothetical protein